MFSTAWCLEERQLARHQSRQAKEIISGKKPADRQWAVSQLLHGLMPPKHYFLEGNTIGCALLSKRP